MHLLPLKRTVWGVFKPIGKEFRNYCMRSVLDNYRNFICIWCIWKLFDHVLLLLTICVTLQSLMLVTSLNPVSLYTMSIFPFSWFCVWNINSSFHFYSRKLVMTMLQQLPSWPTRREVLWRWWFLLILVTLQYSVYKPYDVRILWE
jgi:hypothetical protein